MDAAMDAAIRDGIDGETGDEIGTG